MSKGRSARASAATEVATWANTAPSNSLRYSKRARYADRRAAIRDAIADEPIAALSLIEDGGSASTPTVRALVQEFHGCCADELRWMLDDTTVLRARMGALTKDIEDWERRQDEAAQRLARIPAELSAEERVRRHAGDENVSEQVVAARNYAALAKSRAEAAVMYQAVDDELHQARAEFSRLREGFVARQQVMVAQWERHRALTGHRIAVYQQYLSQRHADGHRLPDMAPAAMEDALNDLRARLSQYTADLFPVPGEHPQSATQQSATPARALRPGSSRRSA